MDVNKVVGVDLCNAPECKVAPGVHVCGARVTC